MSTDKMNRNLIDVLNKELKLLEDYNSGCEILHKYVAARNWSRLERTLNSLGKKADKLNSLDLIREELVLQLKEEHQLSPGASFGMLLTRLDEESQKDIRILKQKLRHSVSLLQIRIQGIGNYAETQTSALKDVLDVLNPDQKGRIYNSRGAASPADHKPMLFNHQF
ncbi:MAG: hypothetical protein PQJ58_12610 [Spirochaetales bacterium]|nr:hypothetical protein [Spirochaetales bacterium]